MKKALLSITLIALLPSLSFAQLRELSNEETASYDSLDNTSTFFARLHNDRSYCCQIWHSGLSNIAPFFESATASTGSLDFIMDRGKFPPYLGAGNTPSSARKCFVFTVSGSNSNSFITLDPNSASNPIDNANLRCEETTLYGGFNTVVTDFNFIEITNTLTDTDLNEDVMVRVLARGSSGAPVLDRLITIEAGKRMDVDVHSSAAQDFGPVIITHNGPQGSIRAVNAQYRIVTEAPLDFEPVLAVPFREGLK